MLNFISKKLDWHPTIATLLGGCIVFLSFLSSGINWWFISFAAIGAFGPGLLREIGMLEDQDEFQRQAAWRAGYHAFIALGVVSFILLAYFRSNNQVAISPDAIVTFLISVTWLTWILSSLISFWGIVKAVSRILFTFGAIWLIFNLLANFPDPLGMLMQSLLAAPFFILGFMAKHWRQLTGILLIVSSATFFYVFRLYEVFSHNPFERGALDVLLLFVAPLIFCGVLMFRTKETLENSES